jgi:hypothetical protein
LLLAYHSAGVEEDHSLWFQVYACVHLIIYLKQRNAGLIEEFLIVNTVLSAIGCGLTMIGLGSYMYMREQWVAEGTEPTATWIPVACIFLFTIASTLGYLVVPWVMIGEVYPTQVKRFMSSYYLPHISH